MLLNNLFYIKTIAVDDNSVKAVAEINSDHKIFEGHFPDQPVVPGVCIMQLVKEILEQVTGKQTMLVKCDYLKFLSVIDPTVNNIIQAELTYTDIQANEISVLAVLKNNNTTCFKLKGNLVW